MSTVIGIEALTAILEGLKGATFGSVVAVTDPMRSGMKKTGNPWITGKGEFARCFLRKITRTGLCLNENYDSGVRRQMEREGLDPDNWTPGKTWYERETREDGTLLPFAKGATAKTEGKRYLCGRSLRVLSTRYIDVRDGSEVSADDVAAFMPAKRSAKQESAGLEKTINRQVWDLNGIRAINLNGERYQVMPTHERADVNAVFEAVGEIILAAANDHKAAEQEANVVALAT